MSFPPTSTTPIQDRMARPLRDLRISVTDRCNFRCPYCMPAEVYGDRYAFLHRREVLRFEEIERLARIFVGLGTSKLRLTGGEPLLRQGVSELVEKLAKLEGVEDLALTTNGYLLAEHARSLRDAGLQRVTVSLDSIDGPTFEKMNGLGHSLARVLDGIEAAERAGLAPLKINCVVQRGVNEDGIVELARAFKGRAIVRFIEYMDVGTLNRWDHAQVVPAREIVERISAELPLEPLEPNYTGEVARRYGYRDGAGEIGVIASVSQPFCGDCTRARLTPDGHLVTCLFANTGADLKGPLRDGVSDTELRAQIAAVWTTRKDRYSEERFDPEASDRTKLEMYQLGG